MEFKIEFKVWFSKTYYLKYCKKKQWVLKEYIKEAVLTPKEKKAARLAKISKRT
ncbi:hypothetical protein [Thalassobellus sediminis]|uniref:hypothetical protein n=1 Tax=Thalassobellus sediminis TaxID=3367753 RepID=UPI0037B6AA34